MSPWLAFRALYLYQCVTGGRQPLERLCHLLWVTEVVIDRVSNPSPHDISIQVLSSYGTRHSAAINT